MRHGIAGNKLSRQPAHRKVTVRNLAMATLIHQRITTTTAKAKEARKLVDKLITLGKKGTLADKRRAFAILCDHKVVSELFNNTSPRFKDRNGGYTRIIPLRNRRGDNAELSLLELTEKVEVAKPTPKEKTSKKKQPNVSEAEIVKETKPETKEAVKDLKAKKDDLKVQPKTGVEQDKSGRKIGGGLKNIFRRQAGGSGK